MHVLRQLAMDSPTHFYVQVIRDVDIKGLQDLALEEYNCAGVQREIRALFMGSGRRGLFP